MDAEANARLQATSSAPITDGPDGATTDASAESPSAGPKRPTPHVASRATARAAATPRADIPASAHPPHCTLVQARPRARRHAASESRHAFAAA